MTSTSDAAHRPRARRAAADGPARGVPGDLLRIAGVASVVVAGVVFGWLAVALFLLVLGGTMVPRAVGTRTALDVTYCAALLAAAWCAQLGVYEQVAWLDLLVHAVTTGAIAALAHQVLVRTGLVGPARRAGAATAVSVVGLGSLVAVVWEVLEWAGHRFVDDDIFVTYTDTLGDLAAALVGSGVAALLVARRARGAGGER